MDPCALGYREDTLLEFIPQAVIAGVSSLDSYESRKSRGEDSFCRDSTSLYYEPYRIPIRIFRENVKELRDNSHYVIAPCIGKRAKYI